MRKIKAVFIKQMLSFFKNPSMIGAPIAFLLIPFMILVLVPDTGDSRGLIVSQFVVMFSGIAMIGTSAGFIMEDRATMNLRFMGMAGVKPFQYLIATCATLLVISLIANVLFGLMLMYPLEEMLNFLAVATLGALCSMMLGITLSLSKLANFTGIIGLILGVGPIFADANEFLERIFYFTFTHQVNTAVRGVVDVNYADTFQVIFINLAIIFVAFVIMNSRTGLDGEKLVKK